MSERMDWVVQHFNNGLGDEKGKNSFLCMPLTTTEKFVQKSEKRKTFDFIIQKAHRLSPCLQFGFSKGEEQGDEAYQNAP